MADILLYGGTFNPIHCGHLLAARAVKEALGFKEVIFIPSADPPHKAVTVSFQDRLQMVKTAIAGERGFDFSACEGDRKEKSFTIDTVRVFRNYGYNVHWLIGSDNVNEIKGWHEYEALCRECVFVAASRPCSVPVVAPEGAVIKYVDTPHLPFSSTEVRKRVKQGLSIRYMVPDSVAEYVLSAKLYKD